MGLAEEFCAVGKEGRPEKRVGPYKRLCGNVGVDLSFWSTRRIERPTGKEGRPLQDCRSQVVGFSSWSTAKQATC